ncbi:hypothetical protein VQ02_33300 [Methylobacterium variabile]|jgi:hypothetical protein|uniref:Uncharacterized protein n=1 Tax=Methylobacterium variabile TaxID=298794 RepID=A0A0J6RWZ3_9HYPH|nr:hypothetical protein [Methylobacterium variabile]KMO27375.1 hypothetical protein VQ02_33300 [Methylobacterium variabile]
MTIHQRPVAPADAVRLDATLAAVAVPTIRLTAADASKPLGAHLDEVSEEERQAAIERSRRLPEPSAVRAAWHALPATVRDRIGEAALLHAFYFIVANTEGREVVLKAANRCEAVASAGLTESMVLAEAALPELFGTAEAEAPWARGEVASVLPVPVAVPGGLPSLDTIATAWDHLPRAAQREVGTLASAFVLYSRVADDMGYPLADRWFGNGIISRAESEEERVRPLLEDAAARSLPGLFGTSEDRPAWAQTTLTTGREG